ncbi:UDP-N-acetylmuramoyl-tripeptide--D-alanyl-D-alanine ligase [Dictyobacter arantiisoli]|uniref:UDP-N-acetylmuramoyl-tripeptide--D-alanyl-D-alanine ligase n=1 Tax=Dictyobacter arantiisoli TaxID=2014874 RepID=A0A5A5TDS2_9CHLR|nr:UDP-N-acetylmuramoyl-tripeptide--D-alanyl-D-alanine ligase [Dictyobacter arantiisoli]GCF09690.1 UDP-N-acetylmuramoyl-tripeptide--D-alanyl-D-alanine ligase [Dictyobacter arantiisoli]
MFTLNDILQGTAGKARVLSHSTPDPQLVFRSAHHDNRQIEPGDLFVALKGAKVDGHRFIAAAAQAGAIGALCTQEVTDDIPADFIQIIVPDVVEALHATARTRAQRQPETTYIGITGSNGKTSTKEAVATVLGNLAPTLKTLASYNTEIGYPLTLLRLEPRHRYAVLEMGAQWVGELAWLCTIKAPDWSLITNVGASHLEYFGSQERVAQAKSELVQALAPEGIAILNYDDPNVRAMHTKTQAQILSYGTSEDARVRASEIGGDALRGRSFTLHYQGEQIPVQLHIPGEHGITIALAAAAVGLAAGLSLTDIKGALEDLTAFKRRGEIKTGPNGSTLIDDSYNANRQSILAIAHTMHEAHIDANGKRWAVLGDILELGSYAEEEHYQTGVALAGLVDYIVAIGEHARQYVAGAVEAGMPEKSTYYFAASLENRVELEAAKQAAAELLKQQVTSNDLVLLKASLGLAMDTLLTMVQA